MSIFFPVAGMNINLLLLIGLGGAVGFIQGMLGSGGFGPSATWMW